MFDICKTTTDQGNVGEAYAIAYFTKQGALVSKPLFVNTEYDLIVDIGGRLMKVQVKSTKQKSPDTDAYVVNLKTSGSNARERSRSRPFNATGVDLLFVLAEDGSSWCIPTAKFRARHALVLNESLKEYLVKI